MIERIALETVILWIEDFKLEKPNEIVTVAHELRPIILGMVSKESTFNPKGPRFEADYQWIVTADVFAKKQGISIATEIALQRFSYGLMQIMGANCRAMGFQGNLLDLAQDTKRTFDYGVRFFLNQIERYDGNIEKALVSYNCGSAKIVNGRLHNEAYADDVINRSNTYRKKWGNVS